MSQPETAQLKVTHSVTAVMSQPETAQSTVTIRWPSLPNQRPGGSGTFLFSMQLPHGERKVKEGLKCRDRAEKLDIEPKPGWIEKTVFIIEISIYCEGHNLVSDTLRHASMKQIGLDTQLLEVLTCRRTNTASEEEEQIEGELSSPRITHRLVYLDVDI